MENWGLKNVETAGPMIAADMITAPVRPVASRRRRGAGATSGAVADDIPGSFPESLDGAAQRCLTSDDFCVKTTSQGRRANDAESAHRRVADRARAADRADRGTGCPARRGARRQRRRGPGG